MTKYGGTGFFYDKAEPLPDYIEHHKPDYHLYDDWVKEQIENGCKKLEFKYYMVYWGKDYHKFKEVFSEFGAVVKLI
jgi:hypothetical protein